MNLKGFKYIVTISIMIIVLFTLGACGKKEDTVSNTSKEEIVKSGEIVEVTTKEVLENIDTKEAILIDVRSEEIYNGKSPREGIPGGHIKGAISVPLSKLIELPKEEQIKFLTEKYVTKDKEIIAYCNTGRQSLAFLKILQSLEYEKIKNYKGSMTEWSSDPSNPIEP